jgi:aminoglycoside 6-adenylyltransferase
MQADPGSAPNSYEDLLARFVEWAKKEDAVRALLVLGSRAREDHPADEWADLDLLLLVRDPQPILSETRWLDSIAPYLLTFVEPTAVAGQSERRVLFEGMYDVDVSVIPLHLANLLANEPPRELLFDVFGRGHRLVLDKDNLEATLTSALRGLGSKPILPPPSEEEYIQAVDDFLYHVVWTAKHLRRGELFWAKRSLDCRLTPLVLQMLEWHSRAERGQDYDTWFRGRFLEEWADPKWTAGLREASARYDEADLKAGLLSIFAMFELVATETSEKLGLPYPEDEGKEIKKWLDLCLGTRPKPRPP